MNTVLLSNGSLEDDISNNPFFKLYESHLVIKYKKEVKIFRLDEISNVRFSKKRNFTINIVLLFITLFVYCFISDYLAGNFLDKILLLLIALLLSAVSLLIRDHTYVLFVNMNHFGFKKLKISKKESLYAEDFVSVFKTKYVEKKNQNNLCFLNFKRSSGIRASCFE